MSSASFNKSVSLSDAFRKLEILSKRYPPQSKTVDVASIGPERILAEDIETIQDIPARRTSTVDGFAIIVNQPGTKRRIVGLSTAVTPYYATLIHGECVRIANGGVVPDGADTVVPFEKVVLIRDKGGEESIEIHEKLNLGESIREKGSEARAGDTLLKDGHKLDPTSIGLLHAIGVSQVDIYKKPRVCVMSIENESENRCKSSNRSQLLTLFHTQSFKAIDVGISRNEVNEIEKNLRIAAYFSCVIVAIGDDGPIQETAKKLNFTFDIEGIFSNLGNFTFAHGEIDRKPVFLCMFPQDPRSSWIGANLFVTPFLKALEGQALRSCLSFKAKLIKLILESFRMSIKRSRSELSNGNSLSTPEEAFCEVNSIIEIPAICSFSAEDIINVLLTESL